MVFLNCADGGGKIGQFHADIIYYSSLMQGSIFYGRSGVQEFSN